MFTPAELALSSRRPRGDDPDRCARGRGVLETGPNMAAATAQAAVQASKSETFPMTTSNRLLDDMARLMTDAAGAAQGVRREVETVMKTQAQRILAEMDVVTREEFEAVREMAIMAREENEKLAARIAVLEEARVMAGRSSEQGG